MGEYVLRRVADDLSDLSDEWKLWTTWKSATLVRRLDEDRYVAVVEMLFTYAVIVGRIDRLLTYDDRWCYHEPATAIAAASSWDGTGEPEGWHRHPTSGRRRPFGDAAKEYVEP